MGILDLRTRKGIEAAIRSAKSGAPLFEEIFAGLEADQDLVKALAEDCILIFLLLCEDEEGKRESQLFTTLCQRIDLDPQTPVSEVMARSLRSMQQRFTQQVRAAVHETLGLSLCNDLARVEIIRAIERLGGKEISVSIAGDTLRTALVNCRSSQGTIQGEFS